MAFLLSMKVSSGMALGFRMRYMGQQGRANEEEARQGRKDDDSWASQRLRRGPTDPAGGGAWPHWAVSSFCLKSSGCVQMHFFITFVKKLYLQQACSTFHNFLTYNFL